MATSERTAVCLVRDRTGSPRELPASKFDEIDAIRSQPGTIVWLVLSNPTADDLRLLEREFSIHPLALEDVRKRGQRPKLDAYADQHMLVVFEAVPGAASDRSSADDDRARPGDDEEDRPVAFHLAELHLFVGSNWLVTVEWDSSAAISAARSQFTGDSRPHSGLGAIVYSLFDAAADSYFPVLDAMAERMDQLEDRVLAGDGGSEGLREMLAIKRELLELRRVLGPMREVANTLLRRDVAVVDDATRPYFQDLYDHLVRLLDQLDLYRDLLASVLDARLTVTSNSLNAVMKRLTAITVLLMVPTLIAGVYGMNFADMPELSWPLGYPFALGLMAASMIGALLFFRSRDWF